jgi:hypothetical protein
MRGRNRSNGNPIGIIIDPSRKNISIKNILNESLWKLSSEEEVKGSIPNTLWNKYLLKSE